MAGTFPVDDVNETKQNKIKNSKTKQTLLSLTQIPNFLFYVPLVYNSFAFFYLYISLSVSSLFFLFYLLFSLYLQFSLPLYLCIYVYILLKIYNIYREECWVPEIKEHLEDHTFEDHTLILVPQSVSVVFLSMLPFIISL